MNRTEQTVAHLIEPSLTAMGYELVRVQLSGGRHPTLQVMAEPANGGPMLVDDCAELSHAISAVLDVEDPIPDAFTLEVSSPGIDRPLTRLKDFERYTGFEAKVEMSTPIDGRKRFTGGIEGVDGDSVVIAIQEGGESRRTVLPFADIHKAKLVLTDELIAAEQARLKQAQPETDSQRASRKNR